MGRDGQIGVYIISSASIFANISSFRAEIRRSRIGETNQLTVAFGGYLNPLALFSYGI